VRLCRILPNLDCGDQHSIYSFFDKTEKMGKAQVTKAQLVCLRDMRLIEFGI